MTRKTVSSWMWLWTAALALAAGAPALAQRAVDFPPAQGKPPPPAKPPQQRVSSGEDTGIIPDGGPTMRKTQQRTPPPPTNLTVMYKLEYGEKLSYTHPDGTVQVFEQWKSFPNDGYELMAKANRALADGMNYQYATKPLASDGFDPLDIPLLYMAGDYAFEFTNREVENLRRFLLDGGTILFNAARGRDEFSHSVVQQMRRVLPNKPFMRLPPDHPIFNTRFRLNELSAMADGTRFVQQAEVYSVDIGTRAAAILVPWGMGAAWSNAREYHPLGKHLLGDSANRLGINIVAYVLGGTEYGRFLSQEFPVYSGQTRPGDAFRFAIARYSGSYDLYPALQNSVLKTLRENLGSGSFTAEYSPAVVDLAEPAARHFPFLFMTGHYDFELTEVQVSNLRMYLERGGVLLASGGAGLSPFDTAFRREMARVLPGQTMFKLPPSHPLFLRGPIPIDRVRYTDHALRDDPTLELPEFYGLMVNDHLAVIYTPYDLMTGVNREPNAFAKGYAPEDADCLLVNIVAWCMSH